MLRNMGESAGVARRIVYEEVATNAYCKNLDEQGALDANSYRKGWYGKNDEHKGNKLWQMGEPHRRGGGVLRRLGHLEQT